MFILERSCPGHNYLYHDTALPLPDYIKDTPFDLIVLDVTLLCGRWSATKSFERLKNAYSFVKDSSAVKMAFPQDEYDCHELLDEWMCEWRIDIVYSVIADHRELLYPKYHKTGEIRLGYTGYIDEDLMDVKPKPFDIRPIDVGYRARKLLPYFGRVGEIKWTIGRDFAKKAQDARLVTDIVIGEQGTLLGEAWLDFINNSKFTLGSNSGSSLLDPRGKIQHDVRAYVTAHPEASFEEVEAACFKGLDSLHEFTAISPRVMEAALLNSCQILVEGRYSGVIEPWEHYIPIKSDASDFERVLEAIQDQPAVQKMISRCRSAILDAPELRCQNRAQQVIDTAIGLISKKNVRSSVDDVQQVIQRYKIDVTPERYELVWRQRRLRQKVVRALNTSPVLLRLARLAYSYVNRRTWS
ncbi:MAG TPA: hypothetical protein VE934_07760 [Polaromonas sp.]|nr:hypothetical protein [Polaromonas sp.]